MTLLQKRVYSLVQKIPIGKVMTYGQVAELAGINNPRAVGQILHRNSSPDVPCHRVVFADGSLSDAFAFGGKWEQQKRLEAEGVKFLPDRRVNLKLYSTNFPS